MNPKNTPRETILTNRFLPLILMILNLSFFFYLIPEHIADEYSISLAILGGVITLILTFWIFFMLIPKLYDKIPIFMGLFGISTLFIFGYLFLVKTTNYNSNELSKNGVLTEAVVVDKTLIYGKRGRTIQNIDVQFVTKKGEQVTANIIVSRKEYDYYSEGMPVMITYSSEHPNIARISYNR
ncbi:MAG: DUF3592 domain-containing protein [Bacteroidota bacterium]